jgi:alpha-glucosidase
MPQQQHMMWSGVDYYGSDIGGFHRAGLGVSPRADADLNTLYTQWFAYSSLFEVPVRPHTENLCNCKETAPDRMGNVASNRASIELRYRLLPYYYSLAYAAWLDGEPVFPSLEYYYDDPQVRGLGHEKMIGPSLVGAAVAAVDANDVSLYLPAGDWYDFRGGAVTSSRGETVTVPVHIDGRFQLPLYARDGAIVPTENGLLRVFGSKPNSFDWYDDDGVSTAYQRGDYSQTHVTVDGDRLTVTPVKGATLAKSVVWTRTDRITSVTIDGVTVKFTQTGSTLALLLPATERATVIEVH